MALSPAHEAADGVVLKKTVLHVKLSCALNLRIAHVPFANS
jgi:hypothetical protein